MKFFVTLGIAFSVLFFGVAPLHAAPQKETPQQLQVRKHYLDALEQARVEYLAAEKKARAELKTAQKGAGKGKKASKKKTQALNAYNKEMKRIRAAFVAAKKDAKTEYAAAKSAPKDEASAAVTEQKEGATVPAAVEEQKKEATPQVQTQPSAAATTPAPQAATPVVVAYGPNGFSPSDVTVKVGTQVTFKNEADDRLWTASDQHTSHTIYPEFDHKQGVEKGGEYTFVFTKTGEWKYHNHLNPGRRGSVKVE